MIETAREVLRQFDPGAGIDLSAVAGVEIEPFGTGLINETYRVTVATGERYVLQRLNPVFDPHVNLDIDALTRHLAAQGAPTQRLVPPMGDSGRLWVEADGQNWRLSTYVAGVCFDRLQDARQATEAGALLGRFHRLVSTLCITLHGERLGVHDTQRHLAALRTAVDEHRSHRYYDRIAPLADEVFEAAETLQPLPAMADRLVHGDPKISNLVFAEDNGAGICMIDLDTLAHMPLPLEIGDAVRSWCNPKGEDERRAGFRMDLFSAAMGGYAAEAGEMADATEWQSFVPAAGTIMVELAARFTRDALRESYFGWNADKFPDRSTHNQVRAMGQLNLYRSFADHQAEAEDSVARAFARAG